MSKLTAIQQEIQVVLSQVNENLLIDTAALIREKEEFLSWEKDDLGSWPNPLP